MKGFPLEDSDGSKSGITCESDSATAAIHRMADEIVIITLTMIHAMGSIVAFVAN
jgi:hypothetical protein